MGSFSVWGAGRRGALTLVLATASLLVPSEVAAKPKIAGGVDQKPAYMIFLQQAALKRDPGRERAFRLSGYRLAARKVRQLEK